MNAIEEAIAASTARPTPRRRTMQEASALRSNHSSLDRGTLKTVPDTAVNARIGGASAQQSQIEPRSEEAVTKLSLRLAPQKDLAFPGGCAGFAGAPAEVPSVHSRRQNRRGRRFSRQGRGGSPGRTAGSSPRLNASSRWALSSTASADLPPPALRPSASCLRVRLRPTCATGSMQAAD
jgi:hypothetical protein